MKFEIAEKTQNNGTIAYTITANNIEHATQIYNKYYKLSDREHTIKPLTEKQYKGWIKCALIR